MVFGRTSKCALPLWGMIFLRSETSFHYLLFSCVEAQECCTEVSSEYSLGVSYIAVDAENSCVSGFDGKSS